MVVVEVVEIGVARRANRLSTIEKMSKRVRILSFPLSVKSDGGEDSIREGLGENELRRCAATPKVRLRLLAPQ